MSTPVDTFLTNLKLLGFNQAVHCKGTSIIVDQNIFTLNADNTKAFEIISHFLFRSLDRVKTRTKFKHVWPPKTKQQSREYLNLSFRWLEEIKHKSLLKHTPLRKSYFEDCRGEVMNKIMMAFSTHVLEQVLLTKKNIDIIQLDKMDKELLELEIQELGKELLKKESTIDNSKKRWSREGQDIISQLSRNSPKRQKTSNKSSLASPTSFSEINYRLNNTANNILQQKEKRERQKQEIAEREVQEHLERERQFREKQEKLERERAEREKLEQERQRLEEERLEQQKIGQERLEQQKREEQRREKQQKREEQRLLEQQMLEEQKRQQEMLEEQEREQQHLEEQLEEQTREQKILEEKLREQQKLEEGKLAKQRIEEQEHQRLEEERIEEERLRFEKLEQERIEKHRAEKHKFESQKREEMKHDRLLLQQQQLEERRMSEQNHKSLRSQTMRHSPSRSSYSSPSRFKQPSPFSQPSPSRLLQSSPSRLSQPSPSRRSKTPRSTHLRKPFDLRQRLLDILNTTAEEDLMYILPPLPKSPPRRISSIGDKEQEEPNPALSLGRSIKRRSLLSLATPPKTSTESNYDSMEITSPLRSSSASKRSAASPFGESRKGFLISPSRTTALNDSLLTNRDSYSPLAPPSSIKESISLKEKVASIPSASSLFVEPSSSKEAAFTSTIRSSPVRVSNKDSPFMVTKTFPILPLQSTSVNEPLSSFTREPLLSKEASPETSKTMVDSPTRPYEPVSPRRATSVRESIYSRQAPASPHRPLIGSPLRSTSVYGPELRAPASPYNSRLSKETILSPSRSTAQSSSTTGSPKRIIGSPIRTNKVFASPVRPTLRGIDDDDVDMCLQGMESVISIRLEEPPWTPMTTSYSPGDVYVDLNAKTPIARNFYRYNE